MGRGRTTALVRQRFRLSFVVLLAILCASTIFLTKQNSAAGMSTTTTPDPTPIQVLYAGKPDLYPEYSHYLEQAFKDNNLNVDLMDNLSSSDPSAVDYIIYNPKSQLQDFSAFTNLKAVFSLRAGVDEEASNPTLRNKNIPLTRMVDPGLREGMVEYVVGHIMRYHLGIDNSWQQKTRGQWTPNAPPVLARQRTVGILGLGELGGSCADALVHLNFQVLGWSRTEKCQNGVDCYHGIEGLTKVLSRSDVLVLLLPNTTETQNIINETTLSQCKSGVYIVNVGRGSSIHEADLLKALKEGIVKGATLDVFQTEPLPRDHPFWKHPHVLITPHIAAKSRASTASTVIAKNIWRCEKNKPLLYVVDQKAGY